MGINEILNNPYYKECFERASPLIPKGDYTGEDNLILHEFKFLARLVNQLEDLFKLSDMFIQYEPKNRHSKDNASDLDTVRLFTEMTLNKIFAIRETKIQIINQAFGIGVSERMLKWTDVCEFEMFKKSDTYKVFNDFYEDFKHLFEIRNSFIHEADYLDSEYDQINMLDFVAKKSLPKSHEAGKRLHGIIPSPKLKIDEFKLKRYSLMIRWKQSVFSYTHDFLNSIPVKS